MALFKWIRYLPICKRRYQSNAGQRKRFFIAHSIRTRMRNYLMKGSRRLRRSIWRHSAMAINPTSSLSIMTLPVSIFTSFRFEWISMVIKSMTSLRAGEARRLLMLWKRNITSFQVQRSVREQQQKHQRSMLCKGISRNKWQILFVLR